MASAAPASPAPAVPHLSNHYIRRLTSSPKACFVCSRPSSVVLVSHTAGASDFFYVCVSHLADRHFATKIQTQSPASDNSITTSARLPDKVSQEEIDKVKAEWEQRQRDKRKQSSTETPAKDDKKEPQQGWLAYIASSIKDSTAGGSTNDQDKQQSALAKSSPPTSSAPVSHEHYALHRSFYNMRVDAHNKVLANKRAKELNFPSVPKG